MDINQFSLDILTLRKSLHEYIDDSDLRQLQLTVWFNRFLFLLGLYFAFDGVNIITLIGWTLYLSSSWCSVAHHVMHGGYDTLLAPNTKFHSQQFAKGWRRFLHWNDWMYPEAWQYEHNVLHHYYTNEKQDPDHVLETVRFLPINSKIIKVLLLIVYIPLWKPFYYVLNTLLALELKKNYPQQRSMLSKFKEAVWKCYFPYLIINFVAFPLLFLPFGSAVAISILANRFIAELLTNIHTFLIIAPNHTGNDIIIYNNHFQDKEEYFLRQVATSINYKSANALTDYLLGHLNYQIEHHLFPNLPASSYRKISAKVQALCEKNGIAYRQHSLFYRIYQCVSYIIKIQYAPYNTSQPNS